MDITDSKEVSDLIPSAKPKEVYFLAAFHYSSEEDINKDLKLFSKSLLLETFYIFTQPWHFWVCSFLFKLCYFYHYCLFILVLLNFLSSNLMFKVDSIMICQDLSWFLMLEIDFVIIYHPQAVVV